MATEGIPPNTYFQPSVLETEAYSAAPPQPLVVTVQQPISSKGLGAMASYILGWILWAYAWCVLGAVGIFFIRSHYDVVSTIEHALLIAVYPLIELFMTVYRDCLVPCYCMMDACFFDMIDKITFWSKSNYEAPEKCGGKDSVYCQNNPHPNYMTEAWFLCGHGHPSVGGQCDVTCTNSTQPGLRGTTLKTQ